MRKLAILLALALMFGITSTAQATESEVTEPLPNPEYTTLQIVNKLLDLQGYRGVDDLANYEQPFETFFPGKFTIAGYGMQSAYAQKAYAYDVADSGNSVAFFGAYTENTLGKLLAKGPFDIAVEWGVKGTTTGGTFYSQSALNNDGQKVHWKLYCMTPIYKEPGIVDNGNTITTVGFLAFEDNVDFDYNDLVLKIEPNPNPVPLPGAVLLLGAGMARLVAYSRRRK